MKVAMSKGINVFAVQSIIACGIAMIVFAAIQLSTVIVVTAGSFLAIIAGMLQLIKPMKSLTTIHASIQRGLAGAESVFSLLEHPLESADGLDLPQRLNGDVEFKNVSFAYNQGPLVLKAINFSIAAGQTVAIVGHSGGGKTTLASLLPRFYEVSEGQILVDNYPIETLSLASLRKQIALVSQHVTLFNDTIANNIAYGLDDVTLEQIKNASKLAYADEFIQNLSDGYNTIIGENGVLLSGGQRQRLAIARAILKNAPILILDEATSALDNESERYIQSALETVVKNRTTLIIAHRLSTIQKADNIIVLHQGNIVEIGTHDKLLELNGYYAQLYSESFTQVNASIEVYAC